MIFMNNKDLNLLDQGAFEMAAECLKAIAHPVRLRMIQMMLQGRFTVGELAEANEVLSHVASEHLRLMQRCRLLESEREGKKVYYKVADPHLNQIMQCIEKRFSEMSLPGGI